MMNMAALNTADKVIVQLGNSTDTHGADMAECIRITEPNEYNITYYITPKGVAVVSVGSNGVLNSTSVMPLTYANVIRRWLLCSEEDIAVLVEMQAGLDIKANSKDDPEAYATYPEVEWY